MCDTERDIVAVMMSQQSDTEEGAAGRRITGREESLCQRKPREKSFSRWDLQSY